MTKKELQDYKTLQAEQKRLKKLISNLNDQIDKMKKEGMVTDSVTGGMGGIQHYIIRGFPNNSYTRKKTRLYLNRCHLEKVEYQIDEIEKFILSIDDVLLRTILSMTYIDGLTQEQIGEQLHMDRSTVGKKIVKFLGV